MLYNNLNGKEHKQEYNLFDKNLITNVGSILLSCKLIRLDENGMERKSFKSRSKNLKPGEMIKQKIKEDESKYQQLDIPPKLKEYINKVWGKYDTNRDGLIQYYEV